MTIHDHKELVARLSLVDHNLSGADASFLGPASHGAAGLAGAGAEEGHFSQVIDKRLSASHAPNLRHVTSSAPG